MCFDALVFMLSAYKVVQLWLQGGRSSILRIILRDGLLYYSLCTAVQIGNLVYFYVSPATANKAFLSPLVIWVTSMSVSVKALESVFAQMGRGIESLLLTWYVLLLDATSRRPAGKPRYAQSA